MIFTTEQRRSMTSSILEQKNFIENSIKFSDQIESSFGFKSNEDKTNRQTFRILNSELTGLAYEYKFITGHHHSMLEETETTYISAESDGTYLTKSLWDSYILQEAASLKNPTDFFLDAYEGSDAYYPEHPIKYSGWIDDYTLIVDTEENLINLSRTILDWYYFGGVSGNLQNLTIKDEIKYYDSTKHEDDQEYATVGHKEYIEESIQDYINPSYTSIGNIILINPTDINNFCLAKVKDSKASPARMLIEPYFIKGVIPNNSLITCVHTPDIIYIEITKSLINKLQEIYINTYRYLTNNPNNNINTYDYSNANIMINVSSCLSLITNSYSLIENENDVNVILPILTTLIDSIELLRSPIWVNRASYISSYLTRRTDLYDDRFKIIDIRLSKKDGTLKELMKIDKGIAEISKINSERTNQINWFKKYFTVKRVERDGDWKRRVFIIDDESVPSFFIGETIYLLSDNENIPEMEATIDLIVDGRLDDITKTDMDYDGNIIKEYYNVKKIFLKNVIINGVAKVKRYIPNTYKTAEGFRIIKQQDSMIINEIVSIVSIQSATIETIPIKQ